MVDIKKITAITREKKDPKQMRKLNLKMLELNEKKELKNEIF